MPDNIDRAHAAEQAGLERKAFDFQLKAADAESGIIEGYANAFGNIDRVGDITVPGAFTDTLASFKADGLYLWQHDSSQPIGKILDAYEDEKGLYIKVQLILTIAKARECYELMKAGVVKKMSIGYSIDEYEWLDADNIPKYLGDDSATLKDMALAMDYGRALKRVTLYEVSAVSIPANPKADLTSVKSGLRAGLRFDEFSELLRDGSQEFVKDAKQIRDLRLKEGRTFSSASLTKLQAVAEGLKAASDELGSLLTAATPAPEKAAELATPEEVLAIKSRIARRRARDRQRV